MNAKRDMMSQMDKDETSSIISNTTAASSNMGDLLPRLYTNPADDPVPTELLVEIDDLFASCKNEEMEVLKFEQVTKEVFKLPKFMNSMVFARVDKEKKGKINKLQFLK